MSENATEEKKICETLLPKIWEKILKIEEILLEEETDEEEEIREIPDFKNYEAKLHPTPSTSEPTVCETPVLGQLPAQRQSGYGDSRRVHILSKFNLRPRCVGRGTSTERP